MEAKISTERVMVDGLKCRKITGWSGILMEKDLPRAYCRQSPYFYLRATGPVGRHAIIDGRPDWVRPHIENCGPTVIICGFPDDGSPKVDVGPWHICLTPGGILTEDAFQALIVWMKRSGSRLAKIRRAEANAWHETEVVVI